MTPMTQGGGKQVQRRTSVARPAFLPGPVLSATTPGGLRRSTEEKGGQEQLSRPAGPALFLGACPGGSMEQPRQRKHDSHSWEPWTVSTPGRRWGQDACTPNPCVISLSHVPVLQVKFKRAHKHNEARVACQEATCPDAGVDTRVP